MRYTEIIATDNGCSTLCKHLFFSLTGLDHYCTEYNSIAPQTTILNLSIMSVHSPSHTPLFLESLSLASCPSLSFLSNCISWRWNSYNNFHTLWPTQYILISQLFVLVRSLLLLRLPNPFFSLVDTHRRASLSQTVSVCRSDIWMCWVIVPRGKPAGGCSSANESLCFQTCCFVRYDKSVGAEPLPLQLQCWALSQRELGDSRATSGRQLRSLITERPG